MIDGSLNATFSSEPLDKWTRMAAGNRKLGLQKVTAWIQSGREIMHQWLRYRCCHGIFKSLIGSDTADTENQFRWKHARGKQSLKLCMLHVTCQKFRRDEL
jgi:hypothetical protein